MKIIPQYPVAGLSGKWTSDSETYTTMRYGKIVMSHYPKHKDPDSISPRQREITSNFATASNQAKYELADADKHALWQQRLDEHNKTNKKQYTCLYRFVVAQLLKQ